MVEAHSICEFPEHNSANEPASSHALNESMTEMRRASRHRTRARPQNREHVPPFTNPYHYPNNYPVQGVNPGIQQLKHSLDVSHIKAPGPGAASPPSEQAKPAPIASVIARIDTNHDGMLGFTELRRAVENPAITGGDAQTVAALYGQRNEISKLNFDPVLGEGAISAGDLAALSRASVNPHATSAQREILNQMNQIEQRTAAAQVDGPVANRSLFFGPDAINPSAIDQGFIGDCYFEAAVASVAKTNPQLIARMIHDNHDGTFTVTFPGDKNHPVTVNRPTEAEMGLYQGAGSYGIWPNVLEKAFGKWSQSRRLIRQGFTDQDGADGGGEASFAIRLMTGHSSFFENRLYTFPEQTRQRLIDAFNHGRAVAATRNDGFLENFAGDTTPDGFLRHHVYSVLGYNPNGPDGGTVTLRNPWGTGGDDTRGTYSHVSFNEFRRNFNHVTYEQGH